MRMWKINPKLLCRKHLLGEHYEMHMFAGSIRKNISLNGYINKGLVEVHNIKSRHEKLAAEMIRRGYNHKSPLPIFKNKIAGKVDIKENRLELMKRCKQCLKRMKT